MLSVPLTLASEGFFHRLWYGAREPFNGEPARIGGGGMADMAPASDMLFMGIFWISLVSFVFLMVLMVIFTVKYRRRPGVPTMRSPAHNTPLELTWTVVPLIVLVWIFFQGFWGYIHGQTGGALPEEISLEAQKWNWGMTYGNGAASPELVKVGARTDVPLFVAPAGVPVLLKMHSIDVIHSFWVPDFRWKQDVFPNRYTAFQFRATPIEKQDPSILQTGKHADGAEYKYIDHYIFCAEYCGDQHSEMAGVLRVLPPKDYVKIVTDWATPRGSDIDKGAFYYKTKGCTGCHSVDGSARTGPSWLDMFGHEVTLSDGSTVVADENYIRESVYNPAAKIVAGFPNSMASQQGRVSQEELDCLIAYMKSISKYAPKSMLEGGAAPAEGDRGGEPSGQGERK